MKRKVFLWTALLALASAVLAAQTLSQTDIQNSLNSAYAKYKDLQEGKNADYIPALAKVDPNLYGIALITTDGKIYTAGDVKSEVSIQSISKVFTLANVLQDSGADIIEDTIGVDPTGQAFNSIVAIEQHKGKEINPFVNPGAIATTSMVQGANADEMWNKIINTYNDFAGRPLRVNEEVYKSESDTNQRNRAIAMLMFAYERIKKDPLMATDLYTRQCSVNVNARDLATMAATLANNGRNPITNKQVLSPEHIPQVLAVMAEAGLYDDSGKWLFATGLPAKSGVGGGIIAVSPGKFGIAVISPPLDAAGNSVRAQRAITDISNALHGNPYVPDRGAAPKTN
ncbi:MAG TPA: glutaminase A [Terriglobia bacterium]|nr:glutaminase A [Terriglobia bacterium]